SATKQLGKKAKEAEEFPLEIPLECLNEKKNHKQQVTSLVWMVRRYQQLK
ncbi:16878_t:CDS:1, partial [Gigaspora rosea]